MALGDFAHGAHQLSFHGQFSTHFGTRFEFENTRFHAVQRDVHDQLVPRLDRALEILDGMGLADKAHAGSSSLSQVELRKMELARAMAAKPQLLISDEAMAGLSGSECDDVLDILIKLNKQGITIIMIEHIMQAVMRFSERLVCLDAGQIICDGDPKSVMANPQVQRAYLGD